MCFSSRSTQCRHRMELLLCWSPTSAQACRLTHKAYMQQHNQGCPSSQETPMTGQSRRPGESERGAPDALSEVWRCDHAHSRAILHFHHATDGREVAVACSAGAYPGLQQARRDGQRGSCHQMGLRSAGRVSDGSGFDRCTQLRWCAPDSQKPACAGREGPRSPARTAAATAAKCRSVTARLRGLARCSASSAPIANSLASAALTPSTPVPA